MAADQKYRCSACGNLTRFDVRSTQTTRAFHHYSIGGELAIEDVIVLSEQIDDVSCRWCDSSTHVVVVSNDPAHDPVDERPGT